MSKPIYAIRIAELRNSKELTQQQLADLLGLTRGRINNYEQGTREPDYDTLRKIADFFKTTTDYLLGLTDEPYRPSVSVTPRDFFPPELAEEMEQYVKYIEIFKDKQYSPEDVAKLAELIRSIKK